MEPIYTLAGRDKRKAFLDEQFSYSSPLKACTTTIEERVSSF